ncbi:MAG TPA: PfkB family carbohydrate kinase [Lacunisphaera sp.]|nr:PfkB family carbohydrate kinase [Lacunisphaera sp.]
MQPSAQPDVICIGAVLWDIIGRSERPMKFGNDVPGRIVRTPGGVALNIAIALSRAGLVPTLLSVIGQDAEGDELIEACHRLGLQTAHLHRTTELRTDRYMAVEDANGLVAAIADAQSLEAAGPQILQAMVDGRLGTPTQLWRGVIALDGNLTTSLLEDIAHSPLFSAADLRVAPASPGKAKRLIPLLHHPRVTFYVNLEEAGLLCDRPFGDAASAAQGLLDRGVPRALVTNGARESCDACRGDGIVAASPPAVTIRRVTGAGDTFLAGHIAAEVRGANRHEALATALAAASAHVAGEIGS